MIDNLPSQRRYRENKIAVALEDCVPNGLHAGSPVLVVGNKTTVAQVVVNEAAIQGNGSGAGATMRLNADVSEGESVRLRQLNAQAVQQFVSTVGDLDETPQGRASRVMSM